MVDFAVEESRYSSSKRRKQLGGPANQGGAPRNGPPVGCVVNAKLRGIGQLKPDKCMGATKALLGVCSNRNLLLTPLYKEGLLLYPKQR